MLFTISLNPKRLNERISNTEPRLSVTPEKSINVFISFLNNAAPATKDNTINMRADLKIEKCCLRPDLRGN